MHIQPSSLRSAIFANRIEQALVDNDWSLPELEESGIVSEVSSEDDLSPIAQALYDLFEKRDQEESH